MKLVRSIALSLTVASVSAFAVACGVSVEHSPQTSASAATKAPIGANAHGMIRLVGDALGEVPLRADQRAEIEKLASEAETRHAPMGNARKELMLAFADQVEKGSIDKAALQPKLDKVTADFETVHADDRAALVKLHGLLDAEQRNAFVDALEKQMKAKHGEHGERGERGHHAGGSMKGFGKLKQLAEDLKLTDDQKTQLREAMRGAHAEGKEAWKEARKAHGPSHAEWKKGGLHGKKALEAFREDKLDLDKLAPPRDGKPMARFGAGRMTVLAEKLVPILTPEQRKIAADKLRTMAASGDAALLGH
jgi:Spy/CpxP family protein refolding chaperone